MASWHPADGSHGGLAGAPDAFCFTCGQYCGGLDAAGSTLVCSHCAALGLPPAEDPPAGDGPEPTSTVLTADGEAAGDGTPPQEPDAALLWGGQEVPIDPLGDALAHVAESTPPL